MEVINYMSEEKKVNDNSVKSMVRLDQYKELSYVITRNKWPIEKVEQIVGTYGNYIMVDCVLKHKKEKKFDVLEQALSARPINDQSIQARLEILPYASKEFKEETKNIVMEKCDLIYRYNYLLKTKDKSCAQQIADEAMDSKYNEYHMIRYICALVPGVDIKKCEDWILNEFNDGEWLEFMLLVPDCNKKRFDKAINDKEYVARELAREPHEFNFENIYDSLVKLGNKEYAKAFFGGHPTKSIEVLKKYAKTAQQKKFVEGLMQQSVQAER